MSAPFRASGPAGLMGPRVRALLTLSLVRTLRPVPVLIGLALAALPMVFAALFSGQEQDAAALSEFLLSRYSGLVVSVLLPLTALVTAAGSISAEREDGTVLYLLTTTTSRTLIVLVRWALATLLTAVLTVASVLGTGLLAGGGADPTGIVAAFTLGSVVGAAVYSALFLAMGVLIPRALLAGLLYLLVWEGIVSRLFAAVRYLSARRILLGVTRGVVEEAERGAEAFATALPAGTAAVWALVLVVGALASAIWRMRRLSVSRPA